METKKIIAGLKKYKNAKNIAGMARFGIRGKNVLGGPNVPALRKMAISFKKDFSAKERHQVAQELWESEIHEARLLAGFLDEPKLVTSKQMEEWVSGFDAWDTCDMVCNNLFDRTDLVFAKIPKWAKDKREYVKRSAFALMAGLAVQTKEIADKDFIAFFPLIKREAIDERNFVRKAVNWALRQIGKRNKNLQKEAIKLGGEILKIDSKSARWISGDALRELKAKKLKA